MIFFSLVITNTASHRSIKDLYGIPLQLFADNILQNFSSMNSYSNCFFCKASNDMRKTTHSFKLNLFQCCAIRSSACRLRNSSETCICSRKVFAASFRYFAVLAQKPFGEKFWSSIYSSFSSERDSILNCSQLLNAYYTRTYRHIHKHL